MTLKFTIEIECDNAAFDPENGGAANEVDGILRGLHFCHIRRMMQDVNDGADEAEYRLLDFNGNRVGTARFTKE